MDVIECLLNAGAKVDFLTFKDMLAIQSIVILIEVLILVFKRLNLPICSNPKCGFDSNFQPIMGMWTSLNVF